MSHYRDTTETSGRREEREEREKGERDLGVQAVVVRQQTRELASLVQARPEQTGDLQKSQTTRSCAVTGIDVRVAASVCASKIARQ